MSPTRARLSGHGAFVIPRPGYQLARVDGGPASSLRVTYREESQLVEIGGTEPISEQLLEVLADPSSAAWRIQTDTFACAWPAGFVLADDPDELSAFVLAGENGALIWVSGPMPAERALPIENLADEDQTVRAVADEGENARIDLDYVLDSEPWWQRRYVLRWDGEVLVVSGQARALDEEWVCVALEELTGSLTPTRLN